MKLLAFSSRHGLIEVEPSPLWAVLEANAVADSKARLALLVETWASLDVLGRARELRLAIWDLVVLALADETQSAYWTDAVAKLGAMKRRALREIVSYRADFIHNSPLLCADNYKQTIEELCRLILT